MMRFYRLPADALDRASETHSGVHVHLGYADVPRGFTVSTMEGPSGIKGIDIVIQYSADRHERHATLSYGRVVLNFGAHSRRLFRVTVNIGASASRRAAAKEAAHDLSQAFDKLESSMGPRMNFAVTRRGLQLEDDDNNPATPIPPPGWLIEAMERDAAASY